MAFVLTQLLGFDYAAAAEVCEVPVGTIRSRVARAREQLIAEMRLEPLRLAGCSAQLPVSDRLDDLGAALAGRGVAVLQAPPGAGKTTVVPLALLDDAVAGGPAASSMLEPRRLATRAAARRMAALRREAVGETVGYRTRDDRAVSARHPGRGGHRGHPHPAAAAGPRPRRGRRW